MELFRQLVAWSVGTGGLLIWVIFLPQIATLLKTKKSEGVSAALFWGSFGFQLLTVLHVVLQVPIDVPLVIVYGMSIFCHVVILCQIYYYRTWPGGRTIKPPSESR